MRTLFVFLISAVVAFFCLPAFSQTSVIGPPNGLEWGMSYPEAKVLLKSKGIDLEDLKEEKKTKLPKGFKFAKVGKYEILNKKTDDNIAFFNADGELCAFRINFCFQESEPNKATSEVVRFWNDELKTAIASKYSGEGFKVYGSKEKHESDQDGSKLALGFEDEVGNEISVYLSPGKKCCLGMRAEAWISIFYNNEEILKATRAERKATDKF